MFRVKITSLVPTMMTPMSLYLCFNFLSDWVYLFLFFANPVLIWACFAQGGTARHTFLISASGFSFPIAERDPSPRGTCLKAFHWSVKVSWRGPKWTWLVEFSEINAVFCNQTRTFIGGRINQEVIKNTNRYKVIKLYAIRQRWLKRIAGKKIN